MTWMRALRLALVPVLAAAYPVLALAARNTTGGRLPGGTAAALAIAALVGVLAWAGSRLLSRDPDRRTLAALAGILWFSAYGAIARQLRGTVLDAPALTLLASGALLAAVVLWTARGRRDVGAFARVARLTVALVLVFPAVSLAGALTRTSRPAPAAATAPPADPSLPSVYLIVLDKYSGTRSLAARHGFDNTPFETRLRGLGFTVPRDVRANYPHTWLSLASLLNGRHVDEMLAGRPQGEWLTALTAAIEDNRAARFFKSIGYEYVFVPSTFPYTSGSALADRQVPRPRRGRGAVNIFRTWIASTPLGPAERRLRLAAIDRRFPYPVEDAAATEEKLEAIGRLASERGRPRFVFAHLLVPHEPYIFRADCSHRDPYWPVSDYGADTARVRRAYVEQITCVNRLLEQLVRRILRDSAVPPVILLQSDHGHAMMRLDPQVGTQLPRARLDPGQVRERADVFAAYHLPGGVPPAVRDSMTVVNLLPAVLGHYFGARIPLAEDRVYWADLHPPFNLELLSAATPPGRAAEGTAARPGH